MKGIKLLMQHNFQEPIIFGQKSLLMFGIDTENQRDGYYKEKTILLFQNERKKEK